MEQIQQDIDSNSTKEDETRKISEELFRVSRELERANDIIRQLQSDLARTVGDVEELKDRLRAANESKLRLENELCREQDEKERLKEALVKAQGFCAESNETILSENLQSDGYETNYIGGIRTTDAEVKGVALLENFIYVLYRSSVEGNHIRVYFDRTLGFRHNRIIKLPHCVDPDGLAASAEAHCLYITDSRMNMLPIVWMIKPENDQMTEWASYQWSLTLSVSLFGHVLLLYDNFDDTSYYLDVLLSDAGLLHTVQLPLEELAVPLAVVETSKRNFIISYQTRLNSNEVLSYICEITADARIIRRFNPRDDPSQHLNYPRYLFVDSWDRVIVADCRSNRVILLDSKLNWNGVVLERDLSVRGNTPRTLLYDNSTQQLFVGPRNEDIQKIDVYHLKLRPPDDKESQEDPNYKILALACAHMNQLPDVVLERILLKACLLPLVISDGKSSSLTREDLLALAVVDHSWYQQLKNNRLHQLIIRKLAAHSRKIYYRKHAIRNNQKYFVESIQPESKIVRLQGGGASPMIIDRGLIDRLHDAKCLSDRQRRLIRRLNHRPRDMIYELLKIARSYDVTHYAAFVDCLRQTKQLMPADVLERGGVTVEVKVILRKESKRFTEEIVSTINMLRDKKFPQKGEVEQLISQLSVDDIEILGAQKRNKGIIIMWLWCHSQESLSRLRQLNLPIDHRPSHLFGITEKLFKNISQAIVLKTLTIDDKQLFQDVAVCPIPIQINTIPNVRGKEFHGVVNHRHKIMVLSQKPKLIQIFDDEHSFDLVRGVEIKKIQNPSDMTAGPDCLYIKESLFDKTKNRDVFNISKVSFESDSFAQLRVVRWLSDLNGAFWLSICRDGKLLLTRQGQPPTLEIYGSNESNSKEAVLVDDVKFNQDFDILQHAVETQCGNFVISYRLANSPKCSIAEVNRSGHIVRIFTAPSALNQVENTYHLALDTYGRVFAADYDSNQVVMLDSQLHWIQVVLSLAKDSLELPGRLWYDEKNKQLIAAQSIGRKDRSSVSTTNTMEPAIYVVDIPAFSKTM